MDRLFRIVIFILSIALLIFIISPIIKILTSTSMQHLLSTLSNGEIVHSIMLSVKISLLSTLFVLITGIPLAYLLARYDFCCKTILESLIDIPIMIPHVAAGIALLMVFGESGLFGKAFQMAGIRFLDTQFGIFIAMMFVSAPFLIDSAKEGFRKVDIRLENVSKTLGANSFWTFIKVTLPNARKDIINGAILMWGRGIGEFGAVVIIAYHPMSAPVMIFDRFSSYGLDYATGITVIMILTSIAIFALIRIINNLLK